MKETQQIILSVLTIFMLSACATLPNLISPPSVQLAQVQLLDASFTRQTLKIDLNVSNPNAFALPIQALTYKLSLEGVEILDGQSQEAFQLAANGTDMISLNVTTNLMKSWQQLSTWLNSGSQTLNYHLTGTVLTGGMLPLNVPFQKAGDIPLVR